MAKFILPTLVEMQAYADKEKIETIKWVDLPIKVVYEIINKNIVKTNSQYNQEGLILTLRDGGGEEEIKVWAPESLKKQIKSKPKAKCLVSYGLVQSTTNPDRKYFSFFLK